MIYILSIQITSLFSRRNYLNLYYYTEYNVRYDEGKAKTVDTDHMMYHSRGTVVEEWITIKSCTSVFTDIPVKVFCNLFDALIKTLFTYNSEINSYNYIYNTMEFKNSVNEDVSPKMLYKYVLEQQEVLQIQMTLQNYDETQVKNYTAIFNI